MKIGLITIHWANNYGASLQTFATLKAFQKFGEVVLLDYRTPHAAKGMQLIRFGINPRDVLRMGKDVFRLIPRYKVIRKFKKFTLSMPLSQSLRSDSDFEQVASLYDLFVCGSDQIWNPEVLGENGRLDPRFMLDFVQEKPKVSYASSIGTYRYTVEQLEQVKELLGGFTAISVREENSAEYLREILGRSVQAVLDPTLLHDHNDWLRFLDLEQDEAVLQPFILVYALKKDSLLKSAVDHYRKTLGMKVVTIDQDPFINFKADQHIRDAAPHDFINLFSKASFVVTNSFHGTCFSVNFNKTFVVTTPPSSPNRIINLLHQVDMMDRFVRRSDQLYGMNLEVDFTAANELLNRARKTSLEFIKNAATVA